MSQVKRITIIGCSVALRVRPPHEDSSKNSNYATLIEEGLNKKDDNLYIVNNQAFSRAIIKELLRVNSKDKIVASSPDYIIVNLGAVDAPSREIPLWFANILFQRSHLYLYPLVHFIYNYLIKNFLRRPLVFLRFKRSWTSKSRFNRDLETLYSFFKKDTQAKVIVLGINKGSPRIERQLPGTLRKYHTYNEILKKCTKQYGIDFVDVSDLNSEDHFPDGVHYNVNGHEIIAERIKTIIEAP